MILPPPAAGEVSSCRYRPAIDSVMKVRDVIRLIQGDGWEHIRTRGSHRQYQHPVKQGLVTVPGKPSDELAPGTFNSILKQAGLK